MATIADRDLIDVTYSDCGADPAGFPSSAVAELVYKWHAGHGGRCLQVLAAHAFLSEQSNND